MMCRHCASVSVRSQLFWKTRQQKPFLNGFYQHFRDLCWSVVLTRTWMGSCRRRAGVLSPDLTLPAPPVAPDLSHPIDLCSTPASLFIWPRFGSIHQEAFTPFSPLVSDGHGFRLFFFFFKAIANCRLATLKTPAGALWSSLLEKANCPFFYDDCNLTSLNVKFCGYNEQVISWWLVIFAIARLQAWRVTPLTTVLFGAARAGIMRGYQVFYWRAFSFPCPQRPVCLLTGHVLDFLEWIWDCQIRHVPVHLKTWQHGAKCPWNICSVSN